ncbi:MAG TPA: PAC2 family protein [Nitrososphaerales archaeon]|nr:PAC2 family protein [Nitrososphaerales archaeon]
MWERLEVDGRPAVEDSVLIVALSTMVPQYEGLYSHARELARFLLRKMDFTRFATLYSSSLPADVAIGDDGLARLRSNSFYSFAGKRRIIMLAGDGSPFDDQQEYANSVLSYASQLGAKVAISVGARWSESPLPPGFPLKPVGFASDAAGVKELEGLGVTITRGEPGPFFANLVVGMSGDYGMRGYKVGVDHGEPLPHPRSLIKIIGVLSKMLDFEVNVKELVVRAKELETEGVDEPLPDVRRERGGIYG